MRTVPAAMSDLWNQGGPFIGADGVAHGRVTVEPDWMLSTAFGEATTDPAKLPFRWWQRIDNSQTEVEVPNIKTIEIDRSLDADAATCDITLYNQWHDVNGDGGNGELGSPGYFTWNYGEGDAGVRWGQSESPWNNILIPNALLRTYQGYGGREKTIEDALSDGNLILTGVWLIDEVRVGTDGMLSMRCRDMGKLLIEQQLFPPLMPTAKYPLTYYRWKYTWVTNPAEPFYDFTDPVQSGPGNEGPKYITDVAMSADGKGYWLVGTDGGVFSFGVPFYGSRGAVTDTDSMVSIAADPLNRGYWTLSENGGVFTFGQVLFYGSGTGGASPDYRRIEAHPGGRGYWLLQKDGTVEAFGDAVHYGDNPASAYDVIDICTTPTGEGYWLLTLGGQVYTYGDALYYGNAPLSLDVSMGMAATPSGDGYWIISYNGLLTAHGGADELTVNGEDYLGNLNDPMVGLAATPTSNGVVAAGGDGGVFSFGDGPFWGSLPTGFTYETKSDGNYLLYEDIIKDLLLWSGWLAYGTSHDGAIYGNIESTGAYSEGDLPPDLFDKRPVIDAINAIKEIVGYHFWIDEEGAVHFESANWYQLGNFLEDGTHVEQLSVIDERYNMTDYTVSYNDAAVRSEIIVSSYDPTAGLNDVVTTRRSLAELSDVNRGMVRPAMWVNEYFSNVLEQETMLEKIVDHIVFSLRQGTVDCVANPALQVNDQVRIYERQTGETFVHYVRGVRTSMDLDAGTFMSTITSNWLGEDWT